MAVAKCLGSCLPGQSNFVDSWHEEREWNERRVMERYEERERGGVPRARGEQRRMGDIETRTVTDKPSVNYKLLRDVPRLRKAPGISLNRGADKAVRCTSKRKRLHEGGCSMITQMVATMFAESSFASSHLHSRHIKCEKYISSSFI